MGSLLPAEADAIRALGAALTTPGRLVPSCNVTLVGKGWGGHHLCYPISPSCVFYSFGISNDYSFDRELAQVHGCKGYAFDPTLKRSPNIHANVPFFPTGAAVLQKVPFPTTNLTTVKKEHQHSMIDVLKMDCEGCEYAISRDVSTHEPRFFDHVHQFAVELHIDQVCLQGCEELKGFGQLLELLQNSGLKLEHAELTPCSRWKERQGCLLDLQQFGFPCSRGKMCQNLLFARQSFKYIGL